MPDCNGFGNPSPLCSSCARIFQGCQDLGITSELMAFPAIRIEPQLCRICLVIWSRHKRLVEKARRLGEMSDLHKIEYLFMRGDSMSSLQSSSFRLRLSLNYINGHDTSIELSITPANSPQQLALTRCLPSSTKSEDSINFLKSQFQRCRENHPTCCQRFNQAPMWQPSRLLEVGGTDSQTVYLRSREELSPKSYFTLSHCWGGMKPMLLTAETEASLRAGTPIRHLPKTFRDAIYVLDKFSISYLWIDSLCIFQDDLEDWGNEAAAMCDVYSNALCNIAATGASDGSIGLFFERDPTSECPFPVTMNWLLQDLEKKFSYPPGTYEVYPCDQWEKDLEQGPLNKRAWVMQERFLSTRIMHFSESQVFWECLENNSGEIFTNIIPRQARPAWFWDNQQIKRIFFKTQRDGKWQQNLYDSWQVFVRAYSRCGLSKESDKLVAIHGVGQLLSKATGNRLVGGLWHHRLLQELCWLRDSRAAWEINELSNFYPQKWRAPTWSWASTNVGMHPSAIRHHEDCPNLQRKATVEAIEIDAFDSGQLKHASLTLRGKLFRATFIIHGPPRSLEYATEIICGNSRIYGQLKSMLSFQLILDDRSSELHYRENLVCLGMFACACSVLTYEESRNKNPQRYLEALALRPCSIQKDQYERVGMLRIPDSAYDFYTANETDTEHSLLIV